MSSHPLDRMCIVPTTHIDGGPWTSTVASNVASLRSATEKLHSGPRSGPRTHLQEVQQALLGVLTATADRSGCNKSLLVVGPRGSGKTLVRVVPPSRLLLCPLWQEPRVHCCRTDACSDSPTYMEERHASVHGLSRGCVIAQVLHVLLHSLHLASSAGNPSQHRAAIRVRPGSCGSRQHACRRWWSKRWPSCRRARPPRRAPAPSASCASSASCTRTSGRRSRHGTGLPPRT